VAVGAALLAAPAQAGVFGKLKKKAETTVTKETDQAVDDAVEKKPANAEPVPAAGTKSGEGTKGSEEAKGGEPAKDDGGTLSSVSTKFDFVPGDHVIFMDDFTQDELGEFPARWDLKRGTFEVAEMDGERWLRCVSTSGTVRMKVPLTLPEFWTLEFDFYGVDLGGSIALTVTALTSAGDQVWEMLFPYSGATVSMNCGSIGSITPLGSAIEGRHHIMFLARGNGLKVYFDRERVANIPDISASGVPAEIDFSLAAPSKPMITNVRFAEGCRPAKDMLAEGKLVTYGIHFDTGSDVVLPESAPVLRQIAAYLEAKPEVKLRITGHTDNVGKPPANLDLSKRRAASVANVLSTQFGIAADRLQPDGKGDAQPLSSNAKPEGRAMNRRVEFSKMEG
jgi:hypothetical protein